MLPFKLYLLFINLLDDRNTTVRQTKTNCKIVSRRARKECVKFAIYLKKQKNAFAYANFRFERVKFDLAKPIRSEHMRLEVYHLRDLVE